VNDQFIAKRISKNKYLSESRRFNSFLSQEQLDRSISSFCIDREVLKRVGMIPHICIISMESKHNSLLFLLFAAAVEYLVDNIEIFFLHLLHLLKNWHSLPFFLIDFRLL
jgi:hypothetical protein